MAYTTINKPTEHFNTLLYTGDNANRSFTGVGFEPSLTWIKARNNTTWHLLYDAVRTAGTGKELHSNSNQAEGASSSSLYGYLSSFDSDGFSTVNGSDASDALNEVNRTYVAWNWKAGTSFTNDASATGIGTIDSTGSVNQDAGFSICSYTGNGTSGASVKHGLSTKPAMMIIKNRDEADSWQVYHHKNTSAPATETLQLNETGATSDTSNRWNDTEPTTAIFTLGNNTTVNKNTINYIGYIFSEKQAYSKFGSYVGNGNADGTFVYTGQKSAFIMLKNTTRGASWLMFDNKRLGYNVDNNEVVANTNAAEETYDQLDILSNGFKLRANGTSTNLNGDTYIYMAFASAPLVGTNNVPCTAR